MVEKPMDEMFSKFKIEIGEQWGQGIFISSLMNEQTCLHFIKKEQEKMQAPDLLVAASMFSKRYAYLVVSSFLYSMTQFQTVMRFTLENSMFTDKRTLFIKDFQYSMLERGEVDADVWKSSILESFFVNNVTPIIEMLHKVSRLPLNILWENVCVRINSVYRQLLENETDKNRRKKIIQDYLFLKTLDQEIFNLKYNPFNKFLNVEHLEDHTHSRKTCCMFHKVENKTESLTHASSVL